MKTKLLSITLLIIICLSNIVNAQNKLTTSSSFSEMNLGNYLEFKTNKQRSVIQKIDSIYKWQWDSSKKEWKKISKNINIVYDSNNNQTSYLYLTWNGSSWLIGGKFTGIFDTNNNYIVGLNQGWAGSVWVNGSRDSYTYDSKNNRTSSIRQYWKSGVWEDISKEIYSYDPNNNLKDHISQYPDNMGNLENADRYSYTYDSKNNRTSSLEQRWTDYWKDARKYIYTYDANNNLIKTIFQQVNWNSDGKFVNMSQYIYTYDSNNNQTDYLYQMWDGTILINREKCSYTYDANNNKTSYLTQQWDQDNNKWLNYFKGTFEYNANNTLIISLGYTADPWGSNNWFKVSQTRNTYDVNYFKKSECHKDLKFDEITIISGDSTYYYPYAPVGINELKVKESNVSIYPNPNNGKFIINSNNLLSTIEVYNLTGKLLFSKYILKRQTSTEIDISDLQKGIYFVRLQDGKQILTMKIIIQ